MAGTVGKALLEMHTLTGNQLSIIRGFTTYLGALTCCRFSAEDQTCYIAPCEAFFLIVLIVILIMLIIRVIILKVNGQV